MGRQIRFYMMPEDELMFLRFVCQDQNVGLLAGPYPTPTLQITEDCLALFQQHSELTTILLWNKAFPIRKSDIQEHRLTEYKEEFGAFVETGEVNYSVNDTGAPVIEFSRSFIRPNGQLVKGRIWAEMYRLEGEDTLVYKGKDFESWYDQIAQWLRHNFQRIKRLDGYFGPRALAWYREGGKLSK